MKKLLILDGIAGISLGEDLSKAFHTIGIEAIHYNLLRMPKVRWHGIKSITAKLLNRARDKTGDAFFYLPKGNRNSLVKLMETHRPDAILVVGFVYKFIDPLILCKLAAEYSTALYLYDTDSCNLYTKRREFIFFLERELPVYHRIFSCSKVTADFFCQSRHLDAHFVPFGADLSPPNFKPDQTAEQHDVLFVGSGDLRRIFVLESIREHVTILGNRWQRNFPLMSKVLISKVEDRPIWGEELQAMLASSKIILNITRGPYYAAGTGVNLRIFEALASGCFLITDYCDEIAELFKPGEEIETFRGPQELRDKVNFYLSHPDQRKAIAQRGHRAFLKRFTWKARAQEMLNQMV